MLGLRSQQVAQNDSSYAVRFKHYWQRLHVDDAFNDTSADVTVLPNNTDKTIPTTKGKGTVHAHKLDVSVNTSKILNLNYGQEQGIPDKQMYKREVRDVGQYHHEQ